MTGNYGHRCICEFNLEESGLTVGHGRGHLQTNARLDNVPAQLHGDTTEEHYQGHYQGQRGLSLQSTTQFLRRTIHSRPISATRVSPLPIRKFASTLPFRKTSLQGLKKGNCLDPKGTLVLFITLNPHDLSNVLAGGVSGGQLSSCERAAAIQGKLQQ